jgi:hypothetical protein
VVFFYIATYYLNIQYVGILYIHTSMYYKKRNSSKKIEQRKTKGCFTTFFFVAINRLLCWLHIIYGNATDFLNLCSVFCTFSKRRTQIYDHSIFIGSTWMGWSFTIRQT